MNILFVCTGNTCRSPMAERYLKSKNLPDVAVKSRGLSADGSPVSKNSGLVMGEIGIDISNHISAQLNESDLAWSDKIICMSKSHKSVLSFYADPKKLFVLGNGVFDPFGKDIDEYRKCRDEIFSAVDSLISEGFFAELQISAMCPEQVKDVAEIEKICFSSPWSEESIEESLKSGTKFFVAEKCGKVLGYIGISCILDEGYIANIAVLPKERKTGVATALLNRVFSLAKDESLSFVSLEVRESNTPAVSLYKKLGFKTEGRRKNFYENPKEDALIMTKRFENE